jgi:multidrug efflux pump subunit AcrA (membrane-fusion protein)
MDVDEADIGNVVEGQNVDVVLDAFPTNTLSLIVDKIDFVSHTTSSGGNAFTVEAKLLENSSYRVGMSGNADIIIDSRRGVISVPSSSLLEDNYLYVKRGKYFEKRKISVGLESDTQAEIISGLLEGDEVAIDPNLVPSSAVKK